MAELDLIDAAILGMQNKAAGSVAQSVYDPDHDPEKAGEAVRLGSATGVNPAIIDLDLERFKRDAQTSINNNIIRNNKYVRNYLISDPMAPKVSSHDIGPLDEATLLLMRQKQYGLDMMTGPMHAFFTGFRDNFDTAGFGHWLPEEQREQFKNNLGFIALSALGELPGRVFTAGLGGVYSAAQNLALRLGMDPADAKRLAREAASIAEYRLISPEHTPTPRTPEIPGEQAVPIPTAANPMRAGRLVEAAQEASVKKLLEAGLEGKPWLWGAIHPPYGVHSVFDEALRAETAADMKDVDEQLKAINATDTHATPEMMLKFLRQAPGRTEMGITAEAAHRLYGDKLPEVDDGVLGWVPNIREQYQNSLLTGADIVFPSEEFFAKIDPGLYKELREDMRFRPGGLTASEIKELDEIRKARDEARKAEGMEEPPSKVAEVPEGEEPPSPREPFREAVSAIRRAAGFEGWESTGPGIGNFSLPYEAKTIALRNAYDKGISVRTKGSTTIDRALKEIDLNHPDFGPYGAVGEVGRRLIPAHLRQIRDRLLEFVKDVPLHIISDEDFQLLLPGGSRAFYDPLHHAIVMAEERYYGPIGTAGYTTLHEAIHAATTIAINRSPELAKLIRSIMDDLLRKRPDLKKNYALKNEHEFLAQGLTDRGLQKTLMETLLDEKLARQLGIKEARKASHWAGIIQYIRFVLGLDKEAVSTLEAILHATDTAMQMQPTLITKYLADVDPFIKQVEKQARLPEEPEPPIEAKATGLTKKQYDLWRKALDARNTKDEEAQFARGKRIEEKKQTAEWKAAEKEVTKEVKTDFENRPDIAVGTFFKEGRLFGVELNAKPKLGTQFLTEEQIAKLPKEFHSRYGLDPDDIARSLGHLSGDDLIDSLVRIGQEVDKSGLSFDRWVTKSVSDEVAKRMEYRYGNLSENIMEHATDHVLGNSQMDLLHEQTMALAQIAGVEPKLTNGQPLTKHNVEVMIKRGFNASQVGSITVAKYLRKAGKSGALAESLLKDDPVGAYKAQQQQYIDAAMAREAAKFEVEQQKFTKRMKTYREATVAGMPQEFLNYVHLVMKQINEDVDRGMDHIQKGIEYHGQGTLKDFYLYHNDVGLPPHITEFDVDYEPWMPIAEFLFDPKYNKSVKNMTVGEFRAVDNSIKAMIRVGREQNRMYVEGAAFDRAKVLDAMKNQLATIGEAKLYHPEQAGVFEKSAHFMRRTFAGLLQLEAMWARIDRADPGGTFTKLFARPFAKAGNEFSTLQREYSKDLRKVEQPKLNFKKLVSDSPYTEPETWDTTPISRPTTRENLIVTMLNMGNRNNFDVWARGHRVEPSVLVDWVNKNAKKEDWDFVQGIWDIYKKIKKEEDKRSFARSGTTVEDIPSDPLNTPFGTYDGGYYPIHPDRTRLKGDAKKILDDKFMYLRPMTSHGWEIKRSGWAGPQDMTLSMLHSDISRRLKDLAFRDVIRETSKIWMDPEFKAAMTRHMGRAYTDLLEPYLRDMAGEAGITAANTQALARVGETIRNNTVATLVGWNPGTVIKHGVSALSNSIGEVGIFPFVQEFLRVWANPSTWVHDKSSNYRWVMEGGKVGNLDWKGSAEVQRRMQHFEETVGGAQDIIMGKPTIRQKAMQWGSKPVAISDMASTIPTWYARYRPSFEKYSKRMSIEEAHTAAEADADAAVRNAHGSTAITSRPEFMRGGVWARGFTSLYGFFNHVLNRYYYMAWKTRDMVAGKGGPVAADLRDLSNRFLFYVVGPVFAAYLAEEYMTQEKKEKHPVLKALAHTVGGTVPIVRDIISGVTYGRDPSAGVWGAAYKAGNDVIRDMSKLISKKADVGASIEHGITMSGVATGVGAQQIGKWSRFVYNYAKGKERPRQPSDYYRILRRGTVHYEGQRK